LSNQLIAPSVGVYLNGKIDGRARALRCSLGSGAEGLPSAEFVIESVGRSQDRGKLENIELCDFEQDECEIVLVNEAGRSRVVHYGTVLGVHATLGDSGDSLTYISRCEDLHFGKPLSGSTYFNKKTSKPLTLHLPAIFNPEVDDIIKPNMATKRHPSLGSSLFIHVESTNTAAALKYAGTDEPKLWTLPEAVFMVCQEWNTSGKITNPKLADLKKILSADTALLRNHELPFGAYLPELLDNLLEPFGYGWTVDLIDRGKRQIRVFAKSSGAQNFVYLQESGRTVDPKITNLHSLSLTGDVAAGSFNSLTVFGEYERYEATFTLVPAWDKALDDAIDFDVNGVSNLAKNSDDWKTDPRLPRVWRDWVLNEAGDYNGTRDDTKTPYDFDSLFGSGKWIARRRRFLPCLSLEDDGHPRGHTYGVFVEWSDDGGTNWYKLDQIDSIGRQILVFDRECGIRFNGDEPPDELRLVGTRLAKVRVTASVESDTRRSRTADFASSWLGAFKRAYLPVGSKFKYRKRDKTSIFESYVNNVFTKDKIEKDDSAEIEKLGTDLLDRFAAASMTGSLSLVGCDHPTIQVGYVVPQIIGRQVALSATKGGGKSPTTVAVQWDFVNQTTALVIGNYRGRRALAA
jgi:hypothetical protein